MFYDFTSYNAIIEYKSHEINLQYFLNLCIALLTLILLLLSLGLTPIHIAAKFGHTELIDKFHKSNVNLRQLSRKTGLTALHIAAYYGNEGTYYDFYLNLKFT